MTERPGVPCPRCGQTLEGITWQATLVPTRLDEAGREMPYPLPDRLVNIPPGRFQARPCGCAIEGREAEALADALEGDPMLSPDS